MDVPYPPPKGGGGGGSSGGMALYANLLGPKIDSSATVSAQPVAYDNGDKHDSAAKKDANPALRFQPIRRPQVTQKKAARPAFPKAISSSIAAPLTASFATNAPNDITSSAKPPGGQPPAAHPSANRSTLADWAATEEDEYAWGTGEKRQRGGRKAKKRRQRQTDQHQDTDWDEIYDPTRPTNVDEYLRSDERIREIQEWKAVLYAHRRPGHGGRGRGQAHYDSDENTEMDERPVMGDQFAPSGDYTFAPPPMSPPLPSPQASPGRPPIPNRTTGNEVYSHRLTVSDAINAPVGTDSTSPPPPELSPDASSVPPPPLLSSFQDRATICRGPVHYEVLSPAGESYEHDEGQQPPAGLGAKETPEAAMDVPKSNRPGQHGFAQRLMSKYGWTAGSGLGANSAGIITPLQVKVEKRHKRPDAENRGFAEPAARARIVGGSTGTSTNQSPAAEEGKYGAMSDVIVLRNMLEGMPNLQDEIESGLGQEIGEECGDKYGTVERLHIDVVGRLVFIKFTDQVSALRAVNSLQGRVFNGNPIEAKFGDTDKFDKGEYT